MSFLSNVKKVIDKIMSQKIKAKDFMKAANADPKLVSAVIWQFGGWQTFKEKAPDVANHGISGGFCGFDSYAATVSFAKRNKKLIIENIVQLSDDMGESLQKVIAGFNCLKNTGIAENDVISALMFPRSNDDYVMKEVYNALAWYAGETVAREYVDYLENEDF